VHLVFWIRDLDWVPSPAPRYALPSDLWLARAGMHLALIDCQAAVLSANICRRLGHCGSGTASLVGQHMWHRSPIPPVTSLNCCFISSAPSHCLSHSLGDLLSQGSSMRFCSSVSTSKPQIMPQHNAYGRARAVEVFLKAALDAAIHLSSGCARIPPIAPRGPAQRSGDPSKRAAPRRATGSTLCLGSFSVHSHPKQPSQLGL
jgi:hypothetical protein